MHVRPKAGGMKSVDADFNAVSLHYSQDLGLFNNSEITKVNVTPPAALEFLRAMVEERPMDCVNCSHCGYPHLDLGNFALQPHRKHFCGNCGRDSTWSKEAIVSTPLKPLHDQLNVNAETVVPNREINLDEYPDSRFVLWASTRRSYGLPTARRSSASMSTWLRTGSASSTRRSAVSSTRVRNSSEKRSCRR